MNTVHGVYGNHSLTTLYSGVEQLLAEQPVTLRELCEFALQHKLTHLWVLPDEQIHNERNTAFLDASDSDWNLMYTWELKGEIIEGATDHLRSVYGWKRAGENRNGFNIIFLGPYAAWKWARKPDITPKQVLWMIRSLEQELGIPITGSPGNTGRKYLESLHPRHKEWFNPPDMNLTELPFKQAAKSLNWARVPTEEELNRKFCIKIDKNSAFPRSGVEYKQGVGTPQRIEGPFDEKLVGIWLCDIEILPDAENLPPTLWQGAEWLPTPIVKRLAAMGCTVTVREAWVFPEAFHVFKTWAENLWGMRSKYQDSRRDAFKQILNDTIGLYRSKKLEQENVFRVRPDWYAQIVGGTRAIMLQNIDSFVKKFGLYPVITAIDCIIYCSDKPLNELLPDNRETLGAYKHVWQLDMTNGVKAILTNGSNANKKLTLLNKLAGEIEE